MDDTLPQWLYQRFSYYRGKLPAWERLDADDHAYWAHEAAAVRRAVARGGFKPNPYLPPAPEDGVHVYWDGPTDIGGNYRCKLCGAYRGSTESEKPCLGEFKESGKMRSWAQRKWDEERGNVVHAR